MCSQASPICSTDEITTSAPFSTAETIDSTPQTTKIQPAETAPAVAPIINDCFPEI